MGRVFTIAEGLENLGALRSGGQGSVYKGRRMGPIITAVKILPTPIHSESEDDKNYRNFRNEVEKLKKVNEIPNPNVVKILSSGITESGSLPYIEMDFIEGPDLEDLLKAPHEAIFTIKEVIKLAEQLASALAHCHRVGVKHGDIKSNNVKFNIHSGNYVLLDFGLSVMSEEQRRSSMRNAGAIEFMAPEQHEGQMLFQTDIYSYGIVLYELLAGQVPFPLQDNGEKARNSVMIAQLETPVPDILELRKKHLPESWTANQQEREMQVPAWLLNLIANCLEKLPENRYSNGTELQENILVNSISHGLDDPSVYNVALLKAENEKLQTQLYRYHQQEINAKRTSVKVPKTIFGLLIFLLLSGFTLGGYVIYKKKLSNLFAAKNTVTNPVVIDSTAKTNPSETNQSDTSAVKPVNQQSLNFPDNDSVNKPTPIIKKKPHKKKKKKFLGIF